MARSVPDTTTFKFSDVCYAIYGSYNTYSKSLFNDLFVDAQESGFSYSGRDSLMDFRNYIHDTAAPTFPTALSVTGSDDTSVSLAWASSDDVGVTAQQVRWRLTGGSWYYTNVDKAATSHTVTSLQSGTEYEFVVSASDALSNATFSNNLWQTTTQSSSISVSPTSVYAPAAGGYEYVSITSNTTWSSRESLGWLYVTDDDGSGDDSSVSIYFYDNSSSDSTRSGYVYFDTTDGVQTASLYCHQDSGGSSCLTKGTKVLLADGSRVNIETLQPGDELMSPIIDGFEDSNSLKKLFSWATTDTLQVIKGSTPVAAITEVVEPESIIINDGLLRATPDHTQLVKHMGQWRFVHIRDLQVGDFIYDENNNQVEVTSVERVEEPVTVYKMALESPTHTFYANGIATHNVKIE